MIEHVNVAEHVNNASQYNDIIKTIVGGLVAMGLGSAITAIITGMIHRHGIKVKLESMDKRFDNIDVSLKSITDDVATVKASISQHDKNFTTIVGTLEKQGEKIVSGYNKSEKMSNNIGRMKNLITKLFKRMDISEQNQRWAKQDADAIKQGLITANHRIESVDNKVEGVRKDGLAIKQDLGGFKKETKKSLGDINENISSLTQKFSEELATTVQMELQKLGH
ncbi:MAG: hypothetical protein FWD15_06260 [Alphaproteobacteria bacterium]|nr:hypothetical protein [Alphaproteobacteria bacterium]